MNIHILYQTGEGQTGKIADFIAGLARRESHDVILIDTSDKLANLNLEDAQKVILAASVHERRHPKAFEIAVTAAKQDLMRCPTMMISVSLKAAFADGRIEAQEYLDEMKMRTGFAPSRELLVAGAVRPDSYDYFQSQIVQHVALEGQEVRLDGSAKEFTDWAKLQSDVLAFFEG